MTGDIEEPEQYFVTSMRVSSLETSRGPTGWAEILPSMWAEGERRPRMAVLASMVDVFASRIPDQTRSPTIDIRVQLTGSAPETGRIEFAGVPLRVGRRMVVGRTTISSEGRTFAIATTTFANRILDTTTNPIPAPETSPASYARLLRARVVDAQALEVSMTPAITNPYASTVQGGAQAMLAELASEHVCPGTDAVDLQIRYLDRMEVGPLRAEAQLLGHAGACVAVDVRLYDAGMPGRTVSHATLVMQPRTPPS